MSQRLRDVYWYYRTYSYMKVPVGTTKLMLVLRILYLFYEVYPGLTELILVLQNLYMYFKSYTCNTELILVLRNLYGSYGSYSCAKAPIGTMSRNRSGSYHIQGHIRLLQIWTLVFRRYRSQIHYTKVTVVTTGLILIRTSRRSYRVLLMQNLYL